MPHGKEKCERSVAPDEGLLKKQVYDSIKDHVTTGLGKRVGNLLEVLRMECCVESLPM